MKKLFLVATKINQDEFSNKKLGLEDDNIFNAVSDEPTEALDNINDEVEEQMTDESMFNDVEVEDDPILDEEDQGEWDGIVEQAEKEDARDPEDCINLMEIVSGYTNNYRKLFTELADSSILEGTGEFNKHPKHEEYEKTWEMVSSIMAESKEVCFITLTSARALLNNRKKMIACCGTKEAPFIYEGLQLAYIQQLHNILMASPYSLKMKENFSNATEAIGLDKDIKLMNRILGDILDAEDMLGTKIRFKEATKSEVTGKSEELNASVYADSDLISEGTDMIVTDFEYAGESIANLIEIKANKALLEYNLIIRDLSLLVSYLVKMEIKTSWDTIRKVVFALIEEEDTEKVEVMLVETCKELDPILVNMAKAYKGILKEGE